MFIDGLDEIVGDYHSFLTLIDNLVDQENVKICLSSRPLLVFEEAFKEAPSLKLQDLTYDSIRAYADTQLSDLIQRRVDKRDIHRVKDLVGVIVYRANGVFLWAVIAIRDVRDGLRDVVDLDELAQTIDNLPSQLESLFMLMLNRIKPAYQRDAARFLQIALYSHSRILHSPLTLCILYFIQSQRSSEDAPLEYDKVATSEIVEACKTLRARLLSHTAGLLDLISDDHRACRLHDTDNEPLLHTKVTFLHRTARDFLHENDQAKSFLARSGFTKGEVHILIARGFLSHLAEFSEHTPPENSHSEPSASYWDFSAAVRNIAQAEKFLGVAQHALIQSLNYDLYVRKRDKASGRIHRLWSEEAYIVDAHLNMVDLVGMAAAEGMTVYICDRLNIPHGLRKEYLKKPYLRQLGFDRSNPATAVWCEPRLIEESGKCSVFLRPASDYRQTLRQFLQVEPDAANPQKCQLWASDAFAETYLLACCTPTCHDLVQILLKAGANPMVKVDKAASEMLWRDHDDPATSFWQQWLEFLQELRYQYMEVNQKSGGFLLNDEDRRIGSTERYVLDTTILLLASGVDVNQAMEGTNSQDYKCYLKRRDLAGNTWDLILEATAMFTLEECFSKEPEFREIADAMSSSIQRPTRRLIEIASPRRRIGNKSFYHERSLPLSVEQRERFWPLIERWESSGHPRDLQALGVTIERTWRDKYPEVDFDYEESDNDA